MIRSSLLRKEQDISDLSSRKEESDQQSEKHLKELAGAKRERERLVREKQKLEERLAKFRDLSLQPLSEESPLEEEWEDLRSESREAGIITGSMKMLEIFRRVKKAAQTSSPVLILGESGTGKELVAQAIHSLSGRKSRSMVVVPIIQEHLVESELFGHKKGAFTGANEDREGFFARADGSTIFLDEVGDIPLNIQVKFLRVLNSGEYSRLGDTNKYTTDARVVAATNRDLKQDMEAGKFREDLFYRLNVIPIELPPLRERKEDIEPLARHFIGIYNAKQQKEIKGLSQKAVEVLMSYGWPGNIRELENVIERAVALTDGGLITEADLELSPSVGAAGRPAIETAQGVSYDDYEDQGFVALLNQNDFNINKTASEMGKQRGAITDRFKGVCLKALAENDWDMERAAKAITLDNKNLEAALAKVREYHDNTLEKLAGYASSEQLETQVKTQFKNMPKKFHQYVLALYEAKRKG